MAFALANPLFPGANVAMGIRMMKDMTFDATPADRGLRLESQGFPSRVRLAHDRRRSIHEHHGLAAVEDHAVLEVMAHGARQHAALDIAALAHEIFRRVAMADALDVLVDDRALIEVAR